MISLSLASWGFKPPAIGPFWSKKLNIKQNEVFADKFHKLKVFEYLSHFHACHIRDRETVFIGKNDSESDLIGDVSQVWKTQVNATTCISSEALKILNMYIIHFVDDTGKEGSMAPLKEACPSGFEQKC